MTKGSNDFQKDLNKVDPDPSISSAAREIKDMIALCQEVIDRLNEVETDLSDANDTIDGLQSEIRALREQEA